MLSGATVTVVAGKGGVGKTTVTAVLARLAARSGRRVLVVELDGKTVLGSLIGDVPIETISAGAALDRYLRDHGFGRIASRLSSSGVIDVVSTAAPGIDDIVVLGQIKQFERSGEWDVILVDGPAAGHAVTFLTSPIGLQRAVRGGPVREQADSVVEMLTDAARCQVMLVTLPETTPVNELIETAHRLTERVGVSLGPVVVNALDRSDPPLADPDDVDLSSLSDREAAVLAAAARFRRERQAMHAAALERLSESLALGRLELPLLSVAALDPATVDELAGDWLGGAPS